MENIYNSNKKIKSLGINVTINVQNLSGESMKMLPKDKKTKTKNKHLNNILG